MPAGKSKTNAATALRLQRQEAALALRRRGKAFGAIAHALGVGRTTAFELVRDGLEDARAQVAASSDELRSEELARLDGMLAKVYDAAEGGDVQAIDRVLKIGERRAKLLGLDAPVRTALQGGGEDAPPITTMSEAKVSIYIPSNGR